MGVALAALAVGAVGAGVSAAGAAQNASATRDQAKFNAYLENKFGKKWQGLTDEYISDKEDKLYGLANIFDRFEGAGAFGDTNTLANLRKAQEDFSALAAGDFEGFDNQLRSIMTDNLTSVFGAGAPIGSYTDLSARAVMDLRREGLDTASAVTNNLHNLSTSLLGLEFGVMDQAYQTKYMLDRNRLSAITGYSTQAAQQAGIGTTAAGNALTSIGSSMLSYGMYQQGLNAQQPSAYRPAGTPSGFGSSSVANPSPVSYRPPTISSPVPYVGGGGGSSLDLPVIGPYDNPPDSVLPSYPGAENYTPPAYRLGWESGVATPAGSLNYGYNTSPFLSIAGSGLSIAGR